MSATIVGRRPESVVTVGRWNADDGPLAFVPGPLSECHVGERTICLLEGALYEAPASAQALAEAYERDGEGVLPGLRGEFWALLWDRARADGIVVCDQLGVRSPYWTCEDGVIHCAGDVSELLAARRRRPAPDPLAIAHWLTVSAAPDGATLYEGVRRLEAGHVLELGTGHTRRYWSPAYEAPLANSRSDAVAGVRAGLERAVHRRLVDATASGVLLSGGLDSGSVAALARCRAYSVTFPHHPDADESSLIDASGLAGVRVAVHRPGVLAGAMDYLDAWGLPPTSPNLFFWAPLFGQARRDGITVMLDGEGGDEVFGFSPYLLADRLRAGRLAAAVELAGRWPGGPGYVRDRLLRYGVRGALPAGAHLLARRFRGLGSYAPPWLDRRLAARWLESSRAAFDWKGLDGPRWWAYLVSGITRGIGPAAVYEQARRRAAAAGIESRHPLVDVDLIELVLSLDPELAFDPRHSRPLLREAMAGTLPEPVRLRSGKSYFDSVFHRALAEIDLPLARRLLDPTRAELAAYVNLVALTRQLFDVAARPTESWALTLWRLVTAECWLRQQSDPDVCTKLRVEATPAEVSIELVGA